MAMTPQELEAHVQTELALKAEIEELVRVLRDSEYRTKTEKAYYADQLAAKRLELREHLGLNPRPTK
jgi:phage-related minor tail protein